MAVINLETSTGGNRRDFPDTDWSELLHLKDRDHPDYCAVLNRLIDHYWKPVYYYIRANQKASVEDVKDLTQQFFTMLLSNRSFETLSQERGSFRGFLKTAVRNFLISSHRAQVTRQPKEGARVFSFDEVERQWLESACRMPDRTPEEAFDQEWAREVMEEAFTLLEQVLARADKEIYFNIFCEYYLATTEYRYCRRQFIASTQKHLAPPSYKALAAQYGLTEHDVGNYLRSVRRCIRPIVKGILKKYVDSGEDIDSEIAFALSL